MNAESQMKELAILLQETSGLMKRRFEQVARPAGLTLLQWRALRCLEVSGPMRQVALVDAIETTPMTVSDMADRLEKARLITREADPEDSRAKILKITDLGVAKLAEMRQTANAVFAEIMAGLTEADITAMQSSLATMKDNLGAK